MHMFRCCCAYSPVQAGPVKTNSGKVRSAFKTAMRSKGGPYLSDDIKALEEIDQGLMTNGLTLPIGVDNRMNTF